jgi:hypothetical protein
VTSLITTHCARSFSATSSTLARKRFFLNANWTMDFGHNLLLPLTPLLQLAWNPLVCYHWLYIKHPMRPCVAWEPPASLCPTPRPHPRLFFVSLFWSITSSNEGSASEPWKCWLFCLSHLPWLISINLPVYTFLRQACSEQSDDVIATVLQYLSSEHKSQIYIFIVYMINL